MPPDTMVTSAWIKQVLAGKKKLLKAKDVVHCNPPRYDEISVKALYDYCIAFENMQLYFPDEYPKGRCCNREYFFTVLATLHPKYIDHLIRQCKEARFAVNDDEQKQEAIELTEEWANELKMFPQFARKCLHFIQLIIIIIV